MYSITIVPVAPMRSEASHRSEMVSQLLFGETAEILAEEKEFVLLRAVYDNYTGWVQRSQLAMTEQPVPAADSYVAAFSGEILINGESCIVPHASVMYPGEWKAGGYSVLSLSQNLHRPAPSDDNEKLLGEFAFRYLHAPYLWGGKTVYGTDCSGFTQQVFKMLGIVLPRDSADQALEGETVEFLQMVKPGDLAFFDNEEGRIIHVGILLNEQQIIHSSGYVHVDPIDSHGITHHVGGQRTHRLRIIKRFF